MARPSKLTPNQWEEIKQRRKSGEKSVDLARAFRITEGEIRLRLRKPPKVQAVPLRTPDKRPEATIFESAQQSLNDEAFVVLMLKMWLLTGELERKIQCASPVTGYKFEMKVGGGLADLVLFHADGGATVLEAKGPGINHKIVAGIGQVCLYAAMLLDAPIEHRPQYVKRVLVAPVEGAQENLVYAACAVAGVDLLSMPSHAFFRQALAAAGRPHEIDARDH